MQTFNIITTILSAFAASQAQCVPYASEKVLDKLVDKLLSRALVMWPSGSVELGKTALGKCKELPIPASFSPQASQLRSAIATSSSFTLGTGTTADATRARSVATWSVPRIFAPGATESSTVVSRSLPWMLQKGSDAFGLAAGHASIIEKKKEKPGQVAVTRSRYMDAISAGDEVLSWVEEKGGGAMIRTGVNFEGVRGLVTESPCEPEDVLLALPLSLAISDGSDDHEPLAGAAPKWTWKLNWAVQLALAVLQRRASGHADPYLDSWPEEPPPLPMMEGNTVVPFSSLLEADDSALYNEAQDDFKWVEEQYEAARDAAAAAQWEVPFPSLETFCKVLQFVFSRNLAIDAGEHGIRRCLVPALDLANHEANSSATFSVLDSPEGFVILLYAQRALQPGDAVTISYGKFTNRHFALSYGFVPSQNPFESVRIALPGIIYSIPQELLGPEPQGGWLPAMNAAVENCTGAKDSAATRMFDLRADGPSAELLQVLLKMLPDGHPAVAFALARTAAAVECGLWGYLGGEFAEVDSQAQRTIDDDAETLSEPSLTDIERMCIAYRLEKRRLLASLRRGMLTVAMRGGEDPEAGTLALESIVAESEKKAAGVQRSGAPLLLKAEE